LKHVVENSHSTTYYPEFNLNYHRSSQNTIVRIVGDQKKQVIFLVIFRIQNTASVRLS